MITALVRSRPQLLLAIALVVGGALTQPALAEERDFASVSCRDVLLAHGEERDLVVLALHAYLLGEKKQLRYDSSVLSAATDKFLDACIAEPEKQALATLRAQFN